MNGRGIAEGLRRRTADVVQGIGEEIDRALRPIVARGKPAVVDIALTRGRTADGHATWTLRIAECRPGSPRNWDDCLRWDVSEAEISECRLESLETEGEAK